jgi:hypothetical protein
MADQPALVPYLYHAEAPAGYRAVLKTTIAAQFPNGAPNLCRLCDWRPECLKFDGTIDQMPPTQNCRGHELVGADGRIYVRRDGCSVIFKRLESTNGHA